MNPITITATVVVPKPPAALKISDGRSLPLRLLSDEQLAQVGDEYAVALLALAKQQRSAGKGKQ